MEKKLQKVGGVEAAAELLHEYRIAVVEAQLKKVGGAEAAAGLLDEYRMLAGTNVEGTIEGFRCPSPRSRVHHPCRPVGTEIHSVPFLQAVGRAQAPHCRSHNPHSRRNFSEVDPSHGQPRAFVVGK